LLRLEALGNLASSSSVGVEGEGSEILILFYLAISGFSRLESCCARFDRLPLFASTGISALILRANLVVGLSTSSACHLVDCGVVVVSCFVVVVFTF
jgi:hypothetical protein